MRALRSRIGGGSPESSAAAAGRAGRLLAALGLLFGLCASPLPVESAECASSAALVFGEPCLGDGDGDGVVTVAELVRAVNHALFGCPVATPSSTRTPRPTETPGPAELELLETLGDELIPSPGIYGCSSSALGDSGLFRMTCELPVAFATVAIRRYADTGAAAAAFAERRGDRPLSSFHGYDAFEYTDVVLQDIPTHTVVWVAETWVFESTQVTAFEDVTVSVDNAERVFELATAAGFFGGGA